MQQLGKISQAEVDDYEKLTNEFGIQQIYSYYTNGSFNLQNMLNWYNFAAFPVFGYWAWHGRKPAIWYVVPALSFVLLHNAVLNRFYKVNLGMMVDLSEWVIENRKAKVWAAEMSKDFTDQISMVEFWKQFKQVAKGYKA